MNMYYRIQKRQCRLAKEMIGRPGIDEMHVSMDSSAFGPVPPSSLVGHSSATALHLHKRDEEVFPMNQATLDKLEVAVRDGQPSAQPGRCGNLSDTIRSMRMVAMPLAHAIELNVPPAEIGRSIKGRSVSTIHPQ